MEAVPTAHFERSLSIQRLFVGLNQWFDFKIEKSVECSAPKPKQ
jgi:hypothetical protein